MLIITSSPESNLTCNRLGKTQPHRLAPSNLSPSACVHHHAVSPTHHLQRFLCCAFSILIHATGVDLSKAQPSQICESGVRACPTNGSCSAANEALCSRGEGNLGRVASAVPELQCLVDWRPSLLGARASLLIAPGIATSNKKLLGTKGIATRSKEASRLEAIASWDHLGRHPWTSR